MKTYEPGDKTHRDENFPVASWLIAKKHREAVLAFYRFARASDDVADHPHLSETEKIAQLDQFEATLLGKSHAITAALPLKSALASRNLSPRHALDLLIAFRQDARKSRYADWGELMHYCAYSAAPVGRFVLDVHGESPSTWPASDALCSALQIINHLQDCKADYQRLNRVYLPQDALARHAATEEELAAAQASNGLRQCLLELTKKTQALLAPASLSVQVKDLRLAIEVTAIEKLAHQLLSVLSSRDPLNEGVHLSKARLFSAMALATLATVANRTFNQNAQPLLSEKP